jgi:hypothetical protein
VANNFCAKATMPIGVHVTSLTRTERSGSVLLTRDKLPTCDGSKGAVSVCASHIIPGSCSGLKERSKISRLGGKDAAVTCCGCCSSWWPCKAFSLRSSRFSTPVSLVVDPSQGRSANEMAARSTLRSATVSPQPRNEMYRGRSSRGLACERRTVPVSSPPERAVYIREQPIVAVQATVLYGWLEVASWSSPAM